jgi:hypothetical protein
MTDWWVTWYMPPLRSFSYGNGHRSVKRVFSQAEKVIQGHWLHSPNTLQNRLETFEKRILLSAKCSHSKALAHPHFLSLEIFALDL